MAFKPTRDQVTFGTVALIYGASVVSQVFVHLSHRTPEPNPPAASRADKPQIRRPIRSADGTVLAESRAGTQLGLDHSRLPKSPGLFAELAEATGISATDLIDRPERGGKVWGELLDQPRSLKTAAIRKSWQADGCSLHHAIKRAYPLGSYASGIVGISRGKENIGGLEEGLDLNSARGEKEPVLLTINARLQRDATESLRIHVERNKAKTGCVVVIEPSTGKLLAVANWPAVDPNGSWKPGTEWNMATMGAYEPGSTFKIVTLAIALEKGIVRPSAVDKCNGQLKVGRRFVRCDDHHGRRAHGTITIEDAIARSCNVAAARWALKIGNSKMREAMRDLRVLEAPDLGIRHAQGGSYLADDPAKELQCANFGFGQALRASPIQLAAAYATIANKGYLVRPRLVEKPSSGSSAPGGRRIFTEATCETVLTAMRSAFTRSDGTAHSLAVEGLDLAGKTGTAQKIGVRDGSYVSNFVGFVPSQNPQAVVLVMIDSPSAGQYYGGVVAGPVFRDVAKSLKRELKL